ncbi:MAPEG family protein [Brevundimonas sp.]
METSEPALTALAVWALVPMFLHFGLIVALYVVLTWTRLIVVRRGQATKADFARADGDPRLSARIQRNLANQFEAPVFAWIGLGLLILNGQINTLDVAAAWLFLIGRVIHSAVQCTGDNVALRGQVFTINFVAILWIMAHAAWDVVGSL